MHMLVVGSSLFAPLPAPLVASPFDDVDASFWYRGNFAATNEPGKNEAAERGFVLYREVC